MSKMDATCWTLIQGAAGGQIQDREQFVHCYGPLVRDYLGNRWRGSSRVRDLDDAVQDVFLECFKERGVLERVDPEAGGGFRGFLYGVIRNVALRFETRGGRECSLPEGDLAETETTLSRVFDRAWAIALLREAVLRQAHQAQQAGPDALRRVDLLRLRFYEDLPIREIARRWQADPANLHHEYARARQEFRAALREVVAFHHSGSPAEVDQVCANLLAAVS